MGEAREFVRVALDEVLPASKIGDAELMTSELVANAVQHPESNNGGTVGLDVEILPEAVRVSVADTGSGFDPVARSPDLDVGGWGLIIVDRVADRWGIERDPHEVWFEIDG